MGISATASLCSCIHETIRTCTQTVSDYQDCLLDCDTFVAWTLEDVTDAIKQCTQAEWIDRFVDRYLDFVKLAQV
jgi:hypothetical protein